MKLEFKRRIVEIVLSADCRLTAYENLEKFFKEYDKIEECMNCGKEFDIKFAGCFCHKCYLETVKKQTK